MARIRDRLDADTFIAPETIIGNAGVDDAKRGAEDALQQATEAAGDAPRTVDMFGPSVPADMAPSADQETIVASDAAGEAPLLDSDLEQGIADIFASLHTAASDARPDPALDDTAGAVDFRFSGTDDDEELDLEAVDTTTFRLLGELDRLWHRAA